MNEARPSIERRFPFAHLERELPNGINLIALFPVSQYLYQLFSNKPEWLDLLGQCTANQHFMLIQQESIIDTFLTEARVFWSSKCKGVLRSERWAQTNDYGIDYTFEAIASILNDKPILLIQHITEDYLDIGQILQSAREEAGSREKKEAVVYRDDFPPGLYDRRGFLLQAEECLLIAKWKRQPVTIVCIGLDRLKMVNEQDNHMIDDLLLLQAALRFKKILRKDDLLGCIKDGDFLAMLPNMNTENTIGFRARLDQIIDDWNARHEPDLEISISIGLASYDAELQTLEQMVNHAVANMHKSKRNNNQAGMSLYTAA